MLVCAYLSSLGRAPLSLCVCVCVCVHVFSPSGDEVVFSELSSHMVAALLKAWLIELPEPLLTFKLYNNFIEAGGM
jgi:RhoGAP domain